MTRQVCHVTEGQAFNQSVGFVANCVIVDNLTQSWLHVPDGVRFVPPFQYGAVIPISGSDVANINWVTPPGLIAGPVGSGIANCTYSDENLPATNGQPVFTQQNQIILGTVLQNANKTFLLPNACQGLMLIPDQLTGPATVTIKGATTNDLYAQLIIGNDPTAASITGLIPVSQVTDASVNVAVAAGAVDVLVVALFTAQQEPIKSLAVTGTVAVSGTVVTQTTPPGANLGTIVNGGNSTFALPAGCQGLLITASSASAGLSSTFTVQGTTTLQFYGGIDRALSRGTTTPAIIPVNITADPSVKVTSLAGGILVSALFYPATEPSQFVNLYGASTWTPGSASGYLQVLQRPTFLLSSTRVSVAAAGAILIAAPGVGSEIVLRKLRFSLNNAAAAADVIRFGTGLVTLDLAEFEIPVGAAAVPQPATYAMDWDDYPIGDNKAVNVSSNVATFANTSIMVTYSVVNTANFPTA